MKKTNNNLIMLNIIFCVSLVVANVVSPKLVNTFIPWFGGGTITIPGAALIYAVSFLMTDVISEIWGKDEANGAVRRGFIAQLFASLFIFLTQYLPSPVWNQEAVDAYKTLLGMNWMFAIGSLTAYYISQSWDVWFFHKIRTRYDGDPHKRYIWNNMSTMTSQIFDTVIFITIAFGLGMGYLRPGCEAYNPSLFFGMLVGQYLIKFVIALCDTPFFYLLTRKRD